MTLVLLLGCARPSGPVASGGDGPPDRCGGCHEDVARAWSESAHALGRADPVYDLAAREAFDPAWCDGCHLPDAGAVGCPSCHLDPDDARPDEASEVLAIRATAAGRRAHPVREVADLGVSACAGCHQFGPPPHQPGAPLGGALLQATVDEWRAAGTSRTCADCHFGPHGHRSPGARNPLDRLRVAVAAAGDGLRLTLLADGVGHAAPTGDPFHRVEVALGRGPSCDEPVVHTFGRFVVPDGQRMIVVADRRALPGAGLGAIEVRRPPGADHFCAQYVFADPAHREQLPPGLYARPLGGGPLP